MSMEILVDARRFEHVDRYTWNTSWYTLRGNITGFSHAALVGAGERPMRARRQAGWLRYDAGWL